MRQLHTLDMCRHYAKSFLEYWTGAVERFGFYRFIVAPEPRGLHRTSRTVPMHTIGRFTAIYGCERNKNMNFGMPDSASC